MGRQQSPTCSSFNPYDQRAQGRLLTYALYPFGATFRNPEDQTAQFILNFLPKKRKLRIPSCLIATGYRRVPGFSDAPPSAQQQRKIAIELCSSSPPPPQCGFLESRFRQWGRQFWRPVFWSRHAGSSPDVPGPSPDVHYVSNSRAPTPSDFRIQCGLSRSRAQSQPWSVLLNPTSFAPPAQKGRSGCIFTGLRRFLPGAFNV